LTTEVSESFDKTELKVLKLIGGNIVVAWTSSGEDHYYTGIFGILLSAEGEPVSRDFMINEQI